MQSGIHLTHRDGLVGLQGIGYRGGRRGVDCHCKQAALPPTGEHAAFYAWLRPL